MRPKSKSNTGKSRAFSAYFANTDRIQAGIIHYVFRSTYLFILFGIRTNYHSSGRNLLLYVFIYRVMKLTSIYQEIPHLSTLYKIVSNILLSKARVVHSVQWLGYEQNGHRSIPSTSREGILSLCHHVQNGSWAHSASYQRVTYGSFPRDKALKASSWPLMWLHLVLRIMSGAYFHYTMSSRHGTYLSKVYVFMEWYLVKNRNNFTFYILLSKLNVCRQKLLKIINVDSNIMN
jgi:hypothetical protein